jgi:hypothetical protein
MSDGANLPSDRFVPSLSRALQSLHGQNSVAVSQARKVRHLLSSLDMPVAISLEIQDGELTLHVFVGVVTDRFPRYVSQVCTAPSSNS